MIESLKHDLANVEEVLERTADRVDLWQDRCVYALALAIFHVIQYILRKEKHSHGEK
jgi:hypothetical protein